MEYKDSQQETVISSPNKLAPINERMHETNDWINEKMNARKNENLTKETWSSYSHFYFSL